MCSGPKHSLHLAWHGSQVTVAALKYRPDLQVQFPCNALYITGKLVSRVQKVHASKGERFRGGTSGVKHPPQNSWHFVHASSVGFSYSFCLQIVKHFESSAQTGH